MKKQKFPRVQDIVGLLNTLAPAALAEEWDNVGLQTGDPAAEVRCLLVTLDPSCAALEQAASAGAQLVVSHHPLIFRPLKHLLSTDETGRALLLAARRDIAVLCAHTNLDRARNGLNDWLAEILGLCDVKVLQPSAGELYKLAVFVPSGYEDAVAAAMFEVGAGCIGDYDQCSFRTPGQGTFRPSATGRPFIGTAGGARERVNELRLETVVPREYLPRVIQRMIKAHPYEEVAYDLYELRNRREDVGLGRIGRLSAPVSLDAFAALVKERLDCQALRVVGAGSLLLEKVALCSGSGASLMGEALRQGADVLVTGDVKYHEAQGALSQGLALLDAGHFATERIMVPRLAEALRQGAAARGWTLDIQESQGESDPFRVV